MNNTMAMKALGICGVAMAMTLTAPASAETLQERTAKRMSAMDTDRDGLVSLEEFTAFRASWTAKRDDAERLMRPASVKRAFDNIDKDGDGVISFDEMQANTANSGT